MSTWVLLRGLMREQRHWGDFPQLLGAAMPGARVVTPDLPGNGAQHTQPSPTRVREMLECCRADLARRGLAPPYSLLALSLGGMLAAEWSARYPGEVAASVLINTSMRPYSRFYERLRWQNYAAILGLLAVGGVHRQEQLILRLTSNRAGTDSALLARWLGYQRDAPVTRRNALRQLLAAARYRAPPRRPGQALLVLAGGADRLVNPVCSQRLAQAWHAPLRVHPQAGHDLPLDDGAWVIAEVLRWQAQAGVPGDDGSASITQPR